MTWLDSFNSFHSTDEVPISKQTLRKQSKAIIEREEHSVQRILESMFNMSRKTAHPSKVSVPAVEEEEKAIVVGNDGADIAQEAIAEFIAAVDETYAQKETAAVQETVADVQETVADVPAEVQATVADVIAAALEENYAEVARSIEAAVVDGNVGDDHVVVFARKVSIVDEITPVAVVIEPPDYDCDDDDEFQRPVSPTNVVDLVPLIAVPEETSRVSSSTTLDALFQQVMQNVNLRAEESPENE